MIREKTTLTQSSPRNGAAANPEGSAADSIPMRLDPILSRARTEPYVVGVSGCDPKTASGPVAGEIAVSTARLIKGKVLLLDFTQPSAWGRHARGFTDLVHGEAEVGDVILPTETERLAVLPAGRGDVQSLIPEAAEAVIKSLRGEYDLIVLALPPVEDTDASLLYTGLADGLVIVIDAQRTRAREANHSLQLLREHDAEVLGAVVHRAGRTLPRWLDRWI